MTRPMAVLDAACHVEPGMVLALEPYKAHWHVQDMVLVRDGPPLLLSDRFPTDEPFVVA